MTLWQKNGGEPQDLPNVDYSGEGIERMAWSNLAGNVEGREACGWTLAPEQPEFDALLQAVAWIDGEWIVSDLPPAAVEQSVLRATLLELNYLLTPIERLRNELLVTRARALSAADLGAVLDGTASIEIQRLAVVRAGETQLSMMQGSPVELLDVDTANVVAARYLLGLFGAPYTPEADARLAQFFAGVMVSGPRPGEVVSGQ